MKTIIIAILGCLLFSCTSSKVVKPTNFLDNSSCMNVIKSFGSLLTVGAESYRINHPTVVATKVTVVSATCDDPTTAKVVFQLFLVVVKNLEPGSPKYCVAQEATALVKHPSGFEFEINLVSTREISTNLCEEM